MNMMFSPDEMKRIGESRESFNGVLQTERQFQDTTAIVGIVKRRIQERGSFTDCLTDFANALARTERFDIMKANSIIRDQFKIITGVTMNQMREALMENEQKLFDRENNSAEAERQKAYMAANEVGRMVKEGTKMTFNRAFAHQAAQLANELNITDVGAKKFIDEVFEETENQPFREYGKELDEKYYRPQIEAEKQQRKQEKSYSRSHQPSHS